MGIGFVHGGAVPQLYNILFPAEGSREISPSDEHLPSEQLRSEPKLS